VNVVSLAEFRTARMKVPVSQTKCVWFGGWFLILGYLGVCWWAIIHFGRMLFS
jgi:hypothetical protein